MDEQEKNIEKDKDNKHQLNHYLIPSRKRLYRSPYNFLLLGVSGGIAEYMNIHSFLIRLLFVITALLGGWGIIAYVICAFLIPEHPSRKMEGIFNRFNSSKLLGFIFIGIGVFYWLPLFGVFRFLNSFDFTQSLVFAIILMVSGLFILLIKKNPSTEKKLSNENKLYRAVEKRRLLGTCEGLANYLNTDVNLIRIVWMILTFITLGLAFVFYLIIGFFIPLKTKPVVHNE